ncbi:hypothetical protein [Vibrio taketomensis]|uniref:hypothetical protein n=1 Tax=Vibrio taketomensis TaxID=2572923 RepID=UPI001389D675|nr:hypothetical protein [Vibrio taketomensis]
MRHWLVCVGVSVAGAAVRVENDVYAVVDSYIEDSAQITATDILVTAYSRSDVDATGTATLSGSFAPLVLPLLLPRHESSIPWTWISIVTFAIQR